MESQNSKALIVAFYLSKYDKEAYINLNFGNRKKTHAKIGQILTVNPNSIKNMRDEFDPYHSNNRAGWYQRPLRPSRQKVFNSFSDLPELALREIVLDILNKKSDESICPILEHISNSNESDDETIYTSRGITGEKAEKFFEENWKVHYPEYSNIENKTKDGCGYDFKLICNHNTEKYVEVKGMKSSTGGILLTSKEWDIAIEEGNKFDLFIVSNINELPYVKIISNPAKSLNPKKQTQTVIQVNWSLSNKQINEA
ncbi:DUF3883 domain-containing protein [Vibrio breoganii]